MKISIVILMAFISLSVFSQKGATIHFTTVKKTIRFPPAIKELQKQDYYKVELPSYFTYHKSAADVATIFEPYELNIPGLKAKYHIGKAIYFFEVQAQGILNVTAKPARYIRDDYAGTRGFLKDIEYNFPCNLIVKMFDGKETKIIRKIEIRRKDEVLTTTFDMSYSNGSGPFSTEAGLNNAFNSNQSALYRTIERGAFRIAFYMLSDAIGNLFSEFKYGKTPIDIAIVKEKKREADFTDLDTLTAKYQRAIDEFYESDKKSAIEHIANVAAEYEKMLGSTDAKIDNNIKQIAKYNLSTCNVFMGNILKAEEWLKSIDKNVLSAESVAIRELITFMNIYKIRQSIENSN